ncbi:MAG: vitamin K epoxide reductase family protein [Vicinamibacterales bacterium]
MSDASSVHVSSGIPAAPAISPTMARLCLVFALLGLGASGAAAYVHYRVLADPTYLSFCDVSATFSCTQVYSSRFGSFQGISVAVFGGIWFAVATLLAVAGLIGRPSVKESVPLYLFAGSTVSLAVILYLAYASFFILKLVCVLCLITYAAVIGLFITSGAASTQPMLTLPRRLAGDLKVLASNPMAIGLTVLFLAGAGSALAFFPRDGVYGAGEGAETVHAAGLEQATAQASAELERFMAGAVRIPLVVPSEGAKVLIVKFNDYQCPACGGSYQAYKPILEKYAKSHPGAVKMVLKDYPLSPKCNNNMQVEMHSGACEAAVAVRLARQKGTAEALEEWLYSHQEGLNPDSVRKAAREIGQITDFDEKYASTLESVKSDIAYGKQLAVRSTPTFFINGIKVEGAWAPQFFDQAIAYELQHPRGQ